MYYENSCRLCLKELNGPGIDCSSITELRDSIFMLFNVEIKAGDTCKSICNKCFENSMAFKAFKNTVNECQKIISDYDRIRKQILQNRRNISIKEEVIDLSDSQENALENFNRRKRHLTNPVTDSQINDILDIVHDNPSKSYSNGNNKKLRISHPISLYREVKTEPQMNGFEPISSSTSKDALNNTNQTQSDDGTRSESICSPTTTGLQAEASTILVKDELINIENETLSENINVSNGTVSSSVQTITHNDEESNSNKRKRLSSPNKSYNSSPSKKSDIDKNETNNNALLTPIRANEIFECSHCITNFKTLKEFETHLLKKHKISKSNEKKSQSTRNKSKSKLDNSVSSTDGNKSETNSTPEGRTLISRQAKSQALKKIVITRIAYSSPNEFRRMTNLIDCENSAKNNNNNNTTPESQLSKSIIENGGKTTNVIKKPETPNEQSIKATNIDKKRTITITLLKAKNFVNFRYTDQSKQIIDFNTVTREELNDIRNSLMIPKVWQNLKNAFKDTPPDTKAVNQLQRIFGEKFHV